MLHAQNIYLIGTLCTGQRGDKGKSATTTLMREEVCQELSTAFKPCELLSDSIRRLRRSSTGTENKVTQTGVGGWAPCCLLVTCLPGKWR